ncbi:MAG: rod-binding protein [Pirellulales bacterium]
MNTISSLNSAATMQLPITLPSRGDNLAKSLSGAGTPRLADAQSSDKTQELRETFTQFVGEAFYGQMFKAMRSTVGKPAYFHGGRAEEVFQGQLDQTMSEQLTKTTASKFAEPMFERQFPHLAEAKAASDLSQLTQLRRQ